MPAICNRAIQDYDQAITLKPDFARAYLCRSDAYHELGYETRAKQDYEQAIKLDPSLESE